MSSYLSEESSAETFNPKLLGIFKLKLDSLL